MDKIKQNEKYLDKIIEDLLEYDPVNGKVFQKPRKWVNKKREVCSLAADGYCVITVKKYVIKAHRAAWRLYYGTWPEYQIDHINGNRSDNRICNLREYSHRENCCNLISHRRGKLVGANYHKQTKCFSSSISINNKQYHLGLFKTDIEAHKQYIKACKALEQREFTSAKELREYIKNMK